MFQEKPKSTYTLEQFKLACISCV